MSSGEFCRFANFGRRSFECHILDKEGLPKDVFGQILPMGLGLRREEAARVGVETVLCARLEDVRAFRRSEFLLGKRFFDMPFGLCLS